MHNTNSDHMTKYRPYDVIIVTNKSVVPVQVPSISLFTNSYDKQCTPLTLII